MLCNIKYIIKNLFLHCIAMTVFSISLIASEGFSVQSGGNTYFVKSLKTFDGGDLEKAAEFCRDYKVLAGKPSNLFKEGCSLKQVFSRLLLDSLGETRFYPWAIFDSEYSLVGLSFIDPLEDEGYITSYRYLVS